MTSMLPLPKRNSAPHWKHYEPRARKNFLSPAIVRVACSRSTSRVATQVNGAIAIAPGGYADGPLTRQKLAESVERSASTDPSRQGFGESQTAELEGAKGTYPIIVKPDIYLTWFDPDGTMTTATAIKKMSAQTPVLFIVPTNDHPGLLKVKQSLFDALPKHPRSRLYEPNADHLGAPSASREEIARWIHEIASSTQ